MMIMIYNTIIIMTNDKLIIMLIRMKVTMKNRTAAGQSQWWKPEDDNYIDEPKIFSELWIISAKTWYDPKLGMIWFGVS